jgi:hypothetical protein
MTLIAATRKKRSDAMMTMGRVSPDLTSKKRDKMFLREKGFIRARNAEE